MKRVLLLILSIVSICLLFTPINAYDTDGVPESVLSKTQSVFYVESWSGMKGSSGTAFLIYSSTDRSLLLTNEHVIDINHDNVSVFLSEKEQCKAKIIASSEQYDLAVLQVSQNLGTSLVFSEIINQGDAVFAVGFPGDADYLSDSHAVTSSQATITNGVVSAIRSMKLVEYGPSVSILQMNADINHGNSGGPLFNSEGYVVGVNTYGVTSASGIYGAISTDSIIEFLKETNTFSYITLAEENSTADVAITPTLINQADSYFDKSIPIYWIIICIAILAIGIITTILLLALRRKRNKHLEAPTKTITLKLDDYLNCLSGSLSCEDVVSLLIPVAKEMRDKHADGSLLIHITPDMICVNESGGFIAQSSDSSFSKPQFAAPEQISQGIANTKTDLYSFCKLMDYMFQYGRAESSNEEAQTEDHQGVLHSELIFNQIIKKGTMVNPDERYLSMQELLYEMAALNVGSISEDAKKPFIVKQGSKNTIQSKSHSRKPILVVGLATLGLIAVVIAGNQILSQRMMDKFARENDPERLYFWTSQSIFGNKDNYLSYARGGHQFRLKHYSEASSEYKYLGDFYYSNTLYKESQYLLGVDYLSNKLYDKALEVFSGLGSYKDAVDKVNEVPYRRAEEMANSGDYDSALEIYQTIIDYKDTEEQIKNTKYRKATALANTGDYDAAIKIFDSIKDYKDSAEQINATKYRKGYSFLSSQQYSKAEDVFIRLKAAGYTAATDALNETYYTWGADLAEKKDYVGAYKKLQNCKNNKDASELIDALIPVIYKEGKEKYEDGKYDEANKRFSAIQSYQRSKDYSFLIECHNSSWLSEQDITKLTNLIGFEDAGYLIFKDNSDHYFMSGGTWYGSNGNIRFYEDSNGKRWYTQNMGLPNGDLHCQNGVWSINGVDVVYVYATGKNTIIVEYVKNGRQYTMTRR